MEWILSVFLLGSAYPVEQIGPFDNILRCEKAQEKHERSLEQLHLDSKRTSLPISRKKTVTYACLRTK